MPNPLSPSAAMLGWSVVVMLALAMPATADTASVLLVPHHATYKLSLAKSTGEKAPADASGRISYEFSGSTCEGYKTVFRQLTEIEPPEGDSRISDMQSTTIEAGDAAQFGFNIRTTYNQDKEDDIDGKATRGKDGDIDVDLKQPTTDQTDLKTSALFPTEHLKTIIATAEDGKKILAVPVYDGSDTGKKVYNTLSVIGAAITAAPPEKAAQADALKAIRRWPVTISYFDQGQGDAQPNYVLSFELYENGISRALRVDYGDFTLAGELVDLTIDTPKPCSK